MACAGDQHAGGLQSMTSLSRVTLPDSVLAADSIVNVLQRMRKRRCFADSDLEKSTLLSEHVLLAAVTHSVAPPHSAFITSTHPCYAVTFSRHTTTGPPTYDLHDVKTTSYDVTAGCHVASQCKGSPPIRRQSAGTANDQLERHDVTKCSSSWCSSSSSHVTMTSMTSAAEQRVVQLSFSSSSASSSSSSSLLPKTTLSFSVESLLAMY